MTTFVLVPGAWCGAWAWSDLAPLLTGDVIAVDLPSAGSDAAGLGDLHDDAAHVRSILDAVDEPAVLVGHSYGGMVVTEVADHPNIAHAVYLTAFWPPAGASMQTILQDLPSWIIDNTDGSLSVTSDPVPAREVMCLDIDAERSAALCEQLRLQSMSSFVVPSNGAAHDHPTTYVICDEDGAIPPPAQEAMSAQADTVHHLAAAHFPQCSVPDQVAEILRACAEVHTPA